MAFNLLGKFNKQETPQAMPAPVSQEKILDSAFETPIVSPELPKPLGEEKAAEAAALSQTATPVATVKPITAKTQLHREIEGILEGDLGPVYQAMRPEKQVEFRLAGEAAAGKIVILLRQTKIKIGQIFKIIFNWLKIIPGANKFFLEQEAKIRSDRLLMLKRRYDKSQK